MLVRRGANRALIVTFMLIFALGGFGCAQPTDTPQDTTDATSAPASEVVQDEDSEGGQDEVSEEEKAAYTQAMAGNGVVSTFIDEEFYNGTIANEDDALEALTSVIDRIGGDETTVFDIDSVRANEDGTTYYVFAQRAGDVLVYGASVKLIANKDGKAIGLVSSIMPGVALLPLEDWATTQDGAEQTVRTQLDEQGVSAEIVYGASEQTLLPYPNAAERYYSAWVVYTTAVDDDVEMAYAAHYVSEDGEYLYCMPVAVPNDDDARSGARANFDFDAYEAAEQELTVTLHDGSEETYTVPVLIDPETGEIYLADAEHKVLCADYASFTYYDELQPTVVAEDELNAVDVTVYNTFLRVWDFYNSINWIGPDDEGTPTILLMNYVDQAGEPVDNACYLSKDAGFQSFCFTREENYGECTDVIAHEFTHCVTATTMLSNLYINDYGAINEAMSDIMGNLVEMMIGGDAGAWTIGEGLGEEATLRSMKDPHQYAQPEYAYDTYYVPAVVEGTDINDQGGVHTNSSLLNLVSYKLDQAGMPINDQFYYWMNVALALTPRTDYPMIAELLPWCMEQMGYTEYVDAVR